jgi:ABC-type uncharacterized transport system involved in gliding motility auxiliary subunit
MKNIIDLVNKLIEINKNAISKKGFKNKRDVLIFTLSVIGIIILLNVLLTRYSFRHDMTENKYYSLSIQTKKILKGLENNLKIAAFVKKGSYQERQIKDLLDEYKHHSKKLDISYIDPDKEPALSATYGIREYNTIVFECGLKRKSVFGRDLFNMPDYYQRQNQTASFFGEEYFTNAIITVTQEQQQRTIYFLEGHKERNINDNEREGMSEIKKSLEMDNYIVGSVNIARDGKIPSDCGVLVIASPRTSIADEELNVLNRYLENGGKMFVLIDPLIPSRIENLLSKWKIELNNDLVFDPQSCYMFDPLAVIPIYAGHDITKDLEQNKVAMVMPASRSMAEIKNNREGVSITKLIHTAGSTAWGERDLNSIKARKPEYNKDIDTEAPCTLGFAVSYWIKASKAEKKEAEEMRMVVIGDSDFASNKVVPVQGNRDFFVNSINWLVKEKGKISIRAKSADIKRIDLSRNQRNFVFITSVIITPLIVLVVGVVVWIKRRKL